MKNNIKLYIPLTITAAFLLFLSFNIINDNIKRQVFHCSHNLSIDINKESKIVKFRTKTEYTYFNDGSGIKVDLGTMSIDGKEYILNRRYIIKYYISSDNIYITIVNIIKSQNDTAPTDESLLQINKQIDSRMKIHVLFGGAYLINVQGYPVAVCT